MRHQFLITVETDDTPDCLSAADLANELQSTLQWEPTLYGIVSVSIETLTHKAGHTVRQGFNRRDGIAHTSTGESTHG